VDTKGHFPQPCRHLAMALKATEFLRHPTPLMSSPHPPNQPKSEPIQNDCSCVE
jgi:hypothetical protein